MSRLQIPVVLVVLQGGVGVARQLQLAMAAGTPAVVVYGSGGVSDVIADLIRHDDELVSDCFRSWIHLRPTCLHV